MPRMMPNEYIAGASAGIRNERWAFSIPITSPLMPKITTVGSIMRSSRTVTSSCPIFESAVRAYKPFRTSHGANIQVSTETTTRMRETTFNTPDAKRHAPRLSSLVRKPVNIGIKAEPNAPPATRLNSSSVTRFAALKESSAALVPKASVITICCATPTRLLRKKANITTPVARAICWLALSALAACAAVSRWGCAA